VIFFDLLGNEPQYQQVSYFNPKTIYSLLSSKDNFTKIQTLLNFLQSFEGHVDHRYIALLQQIVNTQQPQRRLVFGVPLTESLYCSFIRPLLEYMGTWPSKFAILPSWLLSQDDLLSLEERIERNESLTLAENGEDIVAVNEIILYFLRALPDRLFPLNITNKLLEDHSHQQISKSISELPVPNKIFAEYLFSVLHLVSQKSSCTSKNIANLYTPFITGSSTYPTVILDTIIRDFSTIQSYHFSFHSDSSEMPPPAIPTKREETRTEPPTPPRNLLSYDPCDESHSPAIQYPAQVSPAPSTKILMPSRCEMQHPAPQSPVPPQWTQLPQQTSPILSQSQPNLQHQPAAPFFPPMGVDQSNFNANQLNQYQPTPQYSQQNNYFAQQQQQPFHGNLAFSAVPNQIPPANNFRMNEPPAAAFIPNMSPQRPPSHTPPPSYHAPAPGNIVPMAHPPNPFIPASTPRKREDWELDQTEIIFQKKIGSGSFGEVWKGEWAGISVAIKKILVGQIGPKEIAAFRDEINIMTKLRHPNIVQFLGACLEPDLLLVTEFADRSSLFDVLSRPELTWDKSKKILMDVARGMLYLHTRNPPIVHRDIKSLNILVTQDWKGVVADFGLTAIKSNQYLKTYCGSPAWTAPEVLRGQQYDESADVYSFGIVLWEVLSRKPPHEGMSPNVIIGKVISSAFRPPIPNQSPSWYVTLMCRCWDDNPRARPSFVEIVEILKQQLN